MGLVRLAAACVMLMTRHYRRPSSSTNQEGHSPSADFVLCGGPRSWWPTRGRSTRYACPARDGYWVLASVRGLQGRFRQGNVPAPHEYAAAGVLRRRRSGRCGWCARAARTCAVPWPGRCASCHRQRGDEQAVGGVPGCSSPMARTRRGRAGAVGADDAGFALQLTAVRWPGMFLADRGRCRGRDRGPRPPARVTAPFGSGPGPAGGCR
jgi:hypothetical protein